jgi:pimeloyl-ACP methyl ester carboxylesterase
VRSPRYFGSPHQERADAVAKALADFTDDVAIVGISNQGLFLPLVADARPVRRLVYVNALIAHPGRSFAEILKTEPVFDPVLRDQVFGGAKQIPDEFFEIMADPTASTEQKQAQRDLARAANADSHLAALFETCPLRALPIVDNVFICGAQDEIVRPQWQQESARRLLGVEPVVIPGAGHAAIFNTHTPVVADALLGRL